MKLTETQKLILQALSSTLARLSEECMNDDEFNDFIASHDWFSMSVDEFNSEVQNAL